MTKRDGVNQLGAYEIPFLGKFAKNNLEEDWCIFVFQYSWHLVHRYIGQEYILLNSFKFQIGQYSTLYNALIVSIYHTCKVFST